MQDLARAVSDQPVEVAGLMTHFATADETTGENAGFMVEQLLRFRSMLAPLRERLESLADGYAVVEAAVADLLDAGFHSSLAEFTEERLAESGAEPELAARARALLQTAAACAALAERGETSLERARVELLP